MLVALFVFFTIGGEVSGPAIGICLVSAAAIPFVWRQLWHLLQSKPALLALYREGLLFHNPPRATMKELPDVRASGESTRLRAIRVTEARAAWDGWLRVWLAGVPFSQTLNFEFEPVETPSETPGEPQRVRMTVSYDNLFLVPLSQIEVTIARYRGHVTDRQALPSWGDLAALKADALATRFRLQIRTIMMIVLAAACCAAALRGCISEGIR